VREQVEFNRHMIAALAAVTDAFNENSRALKALAARIGEGEGRFDAVRMDAEAARQQVHDALAHWAEWRREWETKLFVNETQFLRSAADLQAGFQHRATLMEANFRDLVKQQHDDYLGALERENQAIQRKFWDMVASARLDYERLIHEELRIVRQREAAMTATAAASLSSAAEPALEIDYGRFAERFRGPEAYVRKGVEIYRGRFEGRANVLDIGCGRGEFLTMMKEAGVPARGVDLGAESVAHCRARGLDVEEADLFQYLTSLADGSLDGIFCAQVVEHLPPARLPEMIRLCAAKLARNGLLAIETPNPECLAIFATHFFLDPTHTRPVPHPLVAFYMEESGFGLIEVLRLAPAVESMPSLASLPEDFRSAFFGSLDYAILGTRL
jgi:2-polyprenyl-3-methyl-5-hydroxy-6-metoxy-1,4-benzoquinol methylase